MDQILKIYYGMFIGGRLIAVILWLLSAVLALRWGRWIITKRKKKGRASAGAFAEEKEEKTVVLEE